MKSEGRVKQQLKQVAFRHLKREIQVTQSRRPCNCVYNQTETVGCGSLSLCTHKGSNVTICDEDRKGLVVCGACPLFKPRKTPDEVREEFRVFLRDSSPAEIAKRYPDIMALKWVLDMEGVGGSDVLPKMFEVDPENLTVKLCDTVDNPHGWRFFQVKVGS